MTTQNFKYSSAHIKSVTIYPITMVLFTCISNTTLIIKCPLSPHKLSDNNPCPTKHTSQFSPKEFLIGRYQHWKSDDRASPSPSLLCTHHSFWELAEGTCSMWESHPSWWELFQRETEKPPIKHTKKTPDTKSERSTSAGNLVLNIKIKHRESFHSPSSKSFMYFKAFLVCLFHQWLS